MMSFEERLAERYMQAQVWFSKINFKEDPEPGVELHFGDMVPERAYISWDGKQLVLRDSNPDQTILAELLKEAEQVEVGTLEQDRLVPALIEILSDLEDSAKQLPDNWDVIYTLIRGISLEKESGRYYTTVTLNKQRRMVDVLYIMVILSVATAIAIESLKNAEETLTDIEN